MYLPQVRDNQESLNQLLSKAGTIAALSTMLDEDQQPGVRQGAASLLAVLCTTDSSSKQQVQAAKSRMLNGAFM